MSAEINAASRLPLIDIETMEGPAGDTLRSLPMRMNIIAMAAHANTCVIPQLMLGNAVMNEQSLSGLRRSEEHTSELQSIMRISYAVFCLKKKKTEHTTTMYTNSYRFT